MITVTPVLTRSSDATAKVAAELAKVTRSTQDGIASLNPVEKLLYNHYRKNMRPYIHYAQDAATIKYNEQVIKDANDALDAFAPYQFKQYKDIEKARKNGRVSPFKLETMELQLRIAVLEAIQKVTALFQRQTIEAEKEMDRLGFKKVRELSDKVLRLAIERDSHYTEADKLMSNIGDETSPILRKYREREANRFRHLGDLSDEARVAAAKERLAAIEEHQARVKLAGKQKEYDLIHELPED